MSAIIHSLLGISGYPLIGAIGGRELCEHIGSTALPRIARLLHARDRVDDLTAKLRRGGSVTVFLGRITPGLRVYTTQLSGLVAMPRRTFVIGLAPGVALYDAVFISLGAWLGLGVLTTIKNYMPGPGVLVVLVMVIGSALAGHALVNHIRRPSPA